MKIKSSRLGEVEIDEKSMVFFEEGIPAFEDRKRFIFLELEAESPFYYMQSVDDGELCFIVAIPNVFFPTYQPEIEKEDLEKIGLEDENDLMVFAILTVPEDFKKTTANLMAPIIVNLKKNKGLQVVPMKSRYTTRHCIFPQQESEQQVASR
ncbi:MAG: flagellar assembly protein FliW [Syntrophomonadaceae bacterium]|nr:flagellar assembly protein FliW [Syntrophomonadaceae bacterium]